MLLVILKLIGITLIPALELRASIPYGIFGMQDEITWPVVVFVCILANIVLGWLIFLVLGPVFTGLRKWAWFNRRIWPILERTQHRIHPYVEKYGELGVAIFIGIPLPGSGVYTGAFGAYLLGLDRKKFIVANVIGVLIAAAAVTTLSLLILHGVLGEESWLAKLFLSKRQIQ
jgi:uncharacterized membrane protein